MLYKALQKSIFALSHYSLVPIREEDMESIRVWRNAQMDVLRQKVSISEKMQSKYFAESIEPTFREIKPPMILFSYFEKEECIGYGGLTNIDWNLKRAEVSFLLNTERGKNRSVYKNDFTIFLTLLEEAAFQQLKFEELFTETYDIRPHHIAILLENGFVLTKRLKKHYAIKSKNVDSLIHVLINKGYHV